MPDALPARSSWLTSCALALALLLLWPTWLALRNGLSGLHARPAIDYLEHKRPDAYILSEGQWRAIESSVAQADRLMPGNPRYLEALGLLHQIRLTQFADTLSPEDVDAHARAVEGFFHEAIVHRPTWPYYWANLAIEYQRRGDRATDKYSVALANASRFGPWRNDNQRLLLELGSANWGLLSPSARRESVLNAERALHRQPQIALRIVHDHGAWPAICGASDDLVDHELPHLVAVCEYVRTREGI